MQVHHKPTKIVVTGQSGSGKTTYVIRYIKNAGYDHVFIFDHKLEFLNRMGIQPEFDRTKLVEHVINKEKIISYNSLEDFPGNTQAGFDFMCEWCYEIARASNNKFLFVCDEFNRFSDNNSVGWEFVQTIEDGRLWGLDFIGTSHAGNSIHNKLRTQFTEIVAFHTEDKTPLLFLEERGFPIDEVQHLAIPGEFILKDCVNTRFVRGKLFSLTSIPKRSTDHETEEQPSNTTHEINPNGGGNSDSGGLSGEHVCSSTTGQ